MSGKPNTKPMKPSKGYPPPAVPTFPSFSGALDRLASKWRTTPTPPPLYNNDAGELIAPIGRTNATRLGYVYQPINCSLRVDQILRLEYDVLEEGSPVFHWDDSQQIPEGQIVQPPALSLMFGAEPLPFTNNNYGRWFSVPQFVLEPGAMIAEVALEPQYWKSALTGTRGDVVASDFLAALKHVSAIAFVLGGGFFAGHGVYVTDGGADIVTMSYEAR